LASEVLQEPAMNPLHYTPLSKPARATLAVAAAFTALSLISAVVSLSEPAQAPMQMAAPAAVHVAAASPR
jgi:hypothetical protein